MDYLHLLWIITFTIDIWKPVYMDYLHYCWIIYLFLSYDWIIIY